MRIIHTKYSGMKPKIDAHLLSSVESQIASNCKLGRGGLHPFRAPSTIEQIDLTSAQSLFRYMVNDTAYWLVSVSALNFVPAPQANDPYERLYFSGENEARFLANDNLSDPPDLTTDYYKLGIPAPTAQHTVDCSGGGTTYYYYLYRFFNSYGDYGPNSPPALVDDWASGRITHEDIESAPADRAIVGIHLFRTNSDSAGVAEYQKVLTAYYFDTSTAYAPGEYVIYAGDLYECTSAHSAGAWNSAHFTAGEAVEDDDLTTVFDSATYYPPPDGLTGLIALDNGALVAVAGNMVCMSEPYKPWAWPPAYQKPLRYSPAGVGALGSNIAVATTGIPTIIYGQHPASMATEGLSDFARCNYPRTIDAWNGSVYFRTRAGMVAVNASGSVNVTDKLSMIDSDSWNDYAPLFGVFFDDKYFGFTASGGVIFDFAAQTVVTTTVRAHACCISAEDGALYMICDDEDAVNPDSPPASMPLCIKKWEGSTVNYLYYTWRGRLELLGYSTNPAYGLLILESGFYNAVVALMDLEALNAGIISGDIRGALRSRPLRSQTLRGDDLYRISGFSISGNVAYKVYADGELVSSKVLSEQKNIFSLEDGYLSRQLEIEISGYVPVLSDGIATSVEELMIDDSSE